MKASRRDFSILLTALASTAASAQEPSKRLPSRIRVFDELPVKTNGENKSRAVLEGETHLGVPVELHQTELAAGASPHAPHRHEHEEIFMLRSGSLDATVNGTTTRMTP